MLKRELKAISVVQIVIIILLLIIALQRCGGGGKEEGIPSKKDTITSIQ